MKRLTAVAACAFSAIVLSASFAAHRAAATTEATGAVAVAVADFDYRDTSGEVKNQVAQHAERMRIFSRMLRERLSADRHYDVKPIDCAKSHCSVGSMTPDKLIAAARHAGARLLIYGGIHKMSTLIQWGNVEVVDLRKKKLLLDRTFTFRGDTDKAFRKAAEFIAQTLQDVTPKS
ncbi:MAG TPA: DUF2380 domain-containing protein [Pseudolabrys sp.]|nr:DUF2380 domain-containing protein [Pseudolabrys sp.]